MTPQQAADIALAQWQAQREAGIPANERIVEMCGCGVYTQDIGCNLCRCELYKRGEPK